MNVANCQSVLWAFDGYEPPSDLINRANLGQVAGLSLFRNHNVQSKSQVGDLVRQLTSDKHPAPLVAIDQEGGQLLGLAESIPYAGNLALGAVDDIELTRQVARMMALELRAVGININYAPVADLMSQPDNPSLGIRSFGSDPDLVARHVGAFIEGLQGGGVMAVTKHFPGEGEADVDPHHVLPVLDVDDAVLETRELIPFRAAIRSGVAGVMVGHQALPSITGRDDLPGSVSAAVISGLLRERLGFSGLVISDALDMAALSQGAGAAIEAIAARRAGVDLLLAGPNYGRSIELAKTMELAGLRDIIPAEIQQQSRQRLATAQQNLAQWTADADVWSDEHRQQANELAAELAERSITVVRDEGQLLPLAPDSRVVAIMPKPTDLTPADTSSWQKPQLAEALSAHFDVTSAVVVDHVPDGEDIAAAVRSARSASFAVVGTITANAAQAELVRRVAEVVPTVVCALRTPFDLLEFPAHSTYLCSYGLLPPSLDALAAVIAGRRPALGRLPCPIGDLHPAGHGIAMPARADKLG